VIDALEEQLSVFREESDVSRLNRTAAAGPVEVEAGLFQLLELSLRLHRDTQGAFDITAGPLSKVWGFYRRAGQIPHPDDLARALATVGSQRIQLDPDRRTVAFDGPGMEVNLGAIGKGYALDRAAERLVATGVGEFLFHGGRSSMLARGWLAEGEPWTVGIGDPLRPGKRLCEVVLQDRGLSTSGSGTQFFRHAGERYGHILDPRTGQPAAGMLSVTVTAPTAAEADALSTAFYVLGIDASLEYCRRRPEIGAILVGQGTPVRVELANWDDAAVRFPAADAGH
jgi:thiamine biosynthesis lipoprotein